jgi:ferritin-like metal-binding protein YciE
MATKTLDNLFRDGLKDIYYTEKKILRTLPKMAKGAKSKAAAFEKHRDQTEVQVERLERIFEMLGKRAQGKTCPAIALATGCLSFLRSDGLVMKRI